MKKILYIALPLLGLIFPYLSSIFITWGYDVSQWKPGDRFILFWVSLLLSGVGLWIAVIISESIDRKKKERDNLKELDDLNNLKIIRDDLLKAIGHEDWMVAKIEVNKLDTYIYKNINTKKGE